MMPSRAHSGGWTEIRTVTRTSLRRAYSMVSDTWLFSGTIYENIAYGQEETPPGGDCRRQGGGSNFIMALPQGAMA